MYGGFAHLYDALMTDVPYEKWADYYFEIFRRFGCKTRLGLDLGCGTGSMTLEMAKRGVEMIGVDLSPDMLDAAKNKAERPTRIYFTLIRIWRSLSFTEPLILLSAALTA